VARGGRDTESQSYFSAYQNPENNEIVQDLSNYLSIIEQKK